MRTRDGGVRRSAIVVPRGLRSITSSPGEVFDAAWLRSAGVPPSTSPRGEVRVVDLFAGCGGLTLGVWEACRALELRMTPLLAVDIDTRALRVYESNFPGALCEGGPVEDLVDGEIGEPLTLAERRLRARLGAVDMVIAGPPCQGNSDLNNHTRRADPRNELYMRVARFCEVVRPTHLIIENVPGVLRDRAGAAQRTWAALEGLGYEISTGTINAADVGVAQRRQRNLTIGSLAVRPEVEAAVEAVREPHRSLMWAIQDLESRYQHGSTFDSSPVPTGETRSRVDFLFDNELFDLPDSQRPSCHRLKRHSYRSSYGRMRPDRPAQTITTGFGVMGKGRFVHPAQRRTVTPHEAARIQFFPDFFSFGSEARTQLQKLIGNAVPPKLGYAIGVHLLR